MPASVVASLFLDIEIALNLFEGANGEHAGVVTQPDRPKNIVRSTTPQAPGAHGPTNPCQLYGLSILAL